MPKRKRAASEGCCRPPTVPLTVANLGRLQEALLGPPFPSRSATSTTTFDAREKLKSYRIEVDQDRALPDLLRHHINDIIRRPRNPDEVPSPNAKNIVHRRKIAAQQNEANARKLIGPWLLPLGEIELDSRGQTPGITQKDELLLNSFFLPSAPSKEIKTTWKDLSQPKPDSCVGYVLRSDAAAAQCAAPFAQEEEDILNDYVLTKGLYMPFLTCQWKAPNGQQGLYNAQSQCARDGSAIVNHLYDLYRVAYDNTPSVVDTCHFSIACDMQYIEMWVHWREETSHYMEQVDNGACRNEEAMLKIRGYIRNIVQYAVTDRLESIRKALLLFAAAKKGTASYPPVREPTIDASGSQALSLSSVVFPRSPAPSSVRSEPQKKRPRVPSDSGFSEGDSGHLDKDHQVLHPCLWLPHRADPE